MEQPKEYYAFISYQRKDEEWADRLRSKLEHYRLPSSLRKQDASLPKEIRPIFRDTLELAGGVLAKEIETALQNSKYLIVICSPYSAKSPWVNKEIQTFIDLGREDHIIPFIIDGTPFSDNEETECFPPALRSLKGEKELLGININELSRDAASIKVVARMFGLKFDTLWQRYEREKKRKRCLLISVAIAAFLCISGVAYWMYWQNQQTKKANWKMMENQARFVAEKAMELFDKGDSYTARLLALKVLPDSLDSPNKPYTAEAEAALRRATLNNSFAINVSDLNSSSASFAFDGSCLLYVSDSIRIWDTNTGVCKSTIGFTNGKNGYDVKYACFSSDGCYVAFTCCDTIRVWNINSKECINTRKEPGCSTVKFSQDGKRIYVACNSHLLIWSIGDNRYEEINNIKHVLMPRYGNHILFEQDSLCYIMSTETNNVEKVHGLNLWRVLDVSPDGHKAILTYGDTVLLWDLDLNKQIYPINDLGSIYTTKIRISPDGNTFASYSTNDKIIKIMDLYTGRPIKTFKHDNNLIVIEYDKDGKRIVSSSVDGTLKVWDVYDEEQPRFYNDSINVRSMAFSNNTAILAYDIYNNYFYRNTVIALLDLQTGNKNEIDSVYYKNPGDGLSIFQPNSFGSDGKYVLFPKNDGSIILWDINNNKIKTKLIGHNKPVCHAMFSPDGSLIASSSRDDIRIWNVEKEMCIDSLFNIDNVRSISFAPNNDIVIQQGNKSLYWNCNKKAFSFNSKCAFSGRYSSDGGYVYFYNNSYYIGIWNSNRKDTKLLQGHNGNINSVAFSPSGNYVISSSDDNTVRVWSVESQTCVKTFEEDSPQNAFFSNDERSIYYICNGGFGGFKIWDFPPLQEIIDETRERFKDRQLTPEERRKYYLE